MDVGILNALTSLIKKHSPNIAPERLDEELPRRVERTIHWCREKAVEIIPLNDCGSLLPQIDSPPRLLFLRGDKALLKLYSFSVVGRRRPTIYGKRAAVHFGRDLSRGGFCVVSGLAEGIDGIVHQSVLDVRGWTLAVVGHGLDRIYPSHHRSLAQAIVDSGGAIVSEYPPGVPPYPQHFPARNRIIAGLSLGTLVIEAAEKSGSLITARHALDQNRDVFVLPGHFDDPAYAGSHRLIQEGAKLITHSKQIFEDYSHLVAGIETKADVNSKLRGVFLKEGGELSLDGLLSATQDPLPQLLCELEELEKVGEVVSISPQKYLWVGS